MTRLPIAILMRTDKTQGSALPPPEAAKEHFAYSMGLMKQGKLRAFGPFAGSPDKLGVFIYGAMPVEDARKLAEADPLVTGGWSKAAMHIWFVADEAVPKP
jgi:uncharacterized protein YciI